jgi:hypothetical protein
VELEQKDNHLYIKAFLLDSSVNANAWGVSPDTLDTNINSFIGRPIVVTADFGHPESNDPNFEHHLNYQDQFRIGTIIDITNKDGQYSAIAEITNEDAKSALIQGNLPSYVSPQIFHDGVGKEPDDNARTWRGTHLAIVKEPAFGVKKARVSGQCNGNAETCVAQLKKASCNFCIKSIIKKYVSNNVNKVSSLQTDKRIKNSKLEDSNEKVKTISFEEFEKIKQANDDLKKQLKEAQDNIKLKDDVATSLKQANEDLNSRVAQIEKENRTKEIANILSAQTFESDEKRQEQVSKLVDSVLSIDTIRDSYALLPTKQASTKLPQKSASVESEVPYWVRLAKYGGLI